jgi:acetoacetyl-CoA synthetase
MESQMRAVGEIIWEPCAQQKTNSNMAKFADLVSRTSGLDLYSWDRLYAWSIADINGFWQACAQFVDIIWTNEPRTALALDNSSSIRGAKWFEGGTLNFAENLLKFTTDKVVITSYLEGLPVQTVTRLDLWNRVAALTASLKKSGVQKGDRVAGILANSTEAIIAMLATSALGAVWSSCSPDFGVGGIVDRLSQVEPKIVFFTAGYYYGGKWIDCRETISECLKLLPTVERKILVYHDSSRSIDQNSPDNWDDFLQFGGLNPRSASRLAIDFISTNFDHPLYIMFSSGTTGVPKCITHGVGGTLLQHKKELVLHTDVKLDDKLMFFTTCGWMMWNWMVSTLSTGAGIVIFDGAPSYPDLSVLWDVADREGVTIFGTSPKFVQACINADFKPKNHFSLTSLKRILTTGSPLLPEHFEWIYSCIKSDLHLASISGGTDIIGCFALGNPLLPVRVGEIQSPGLGMAIEAWNELGESVRAEKAELVCTKPFVSMPINFWKDPTGVQYTSAYFTHFTNPVVWWHGDFVEITVHGGVIIHGRSDATLNPGGVRIGTAEIYRQVDGFLEIDDSIAIGHRINGDVEVILFVKLVDGCELDSRLNKMIRDEIRRNLTPRHVPARIIAVRQIPYTRSGKKVEIAVTKVIHGEPISNISALANPEALDEYRLIAGQLFVK